MINEGVIKDEYGDTITISERMGDGVYVRIVEQDREAEVALTNKQRKQLRRALKRVN